MADTPLTALLNAKAALDLGLVTESDYNAVKTAFVNAQQIRAAMDAGLVKEEDYEATKLQYLTTLSGLAGWQPAQPPTVAAPLPPHLSSGPPLATVAPHARPAEADRPPPPVRPPSLPDANGAGLQQAPPKLHLPSNIPKVAGSKATMASGVSMSGISVSQDAVNLYYLIRAKSTYRWALWRVDDAGAQVVIASVGEPTSTYADFLAALPGDDCRFGVFDYQFTAPDSHVMNKLVFLNWAPDAAKVKAKMVYASTKDFFKGHFDGMSAEFQASDLDDISEAEVGDAVRALKRV